MFRFLNRLQQKFVNRRSYSTEITETIVINSANIATSKKRSRFDFILKTLPKVPKYLSSFFRVYKWPVGVSFVGKQYDDANESLANHRQRVHQYKTLHEHKIPEIRRLEEFEAIKLGCYGKLLDRMLESLIPLFVFDDMMARILLYQHKNK